MNGYTWQTLSVQQERALEHAFKRWLGTLHIAGQQEPGAGVDCVQLIPGVLCPLFGMPKTLVPRQRQDAGIHSPRASARTVLFLRSVIPSIVVRDFTVEPGDIVGIRASHNPGSPRRLGHALIAGVRPWTALHAAPLSRVAMTSLAATTGIVRVYRPRNKQVWGALP